MNPIYNTFHPDGFSTINPYLFASNPEELITFLQNAFYAEEINRTINPSNGEIANCILKVGHSCIMISQARGPFDGMRSAHYLFTEDVDKLYQNALDHGAKSEFAPMDMDYGDRQGGVVDPAGNYWWISRRLVKEQYKD